MRNFRLCTARWQVPQRTIVLLNSVTKTSQLFDFIEVMLNRFSSGFVWWKCKFISSTPARFVITTSVSPQHRHPSARKLSIRVDLSKSRVISHDPNMAHIGVHPAVLGEDLEVPPGFDPQHLFAHDLAILIQGDEELCRCVIIHWGHTD